MKKIILLLFSLSLTGLGNLWAQETEENVNKAKAATPPNMWEISPHGGALFIAGDVDPKFGWGAGISLRKATDYLFSLRLDVLYGRAEGESGSGPTLRQFENSWLSSTVFGVFSLNSLRFNKPVRSTNIYVMGGAGGNYFELPSFRNEESRGMLERELAPHATLGAGIAFRIGPRFNIGIEHQASLLFGKRSDLVDGSELEKGVRTPFRDIVNYSNIHLNFNIGNKQRRSEPLYWINPLQVVLDDIQEIKENQSDVVLEDSDGDGVIDQLDREPNTAPGALVDTKGRTLDSDRDGVPDHLDKEPYYTPREGETVNSEGVVENPIAGGGGVTEERVRELIDEALQDYQPSAGAPGGIADLFLPMLHFGINSSTIKYSDYGTLASIARVMKNNSEMRLVVKGYTDQTGSESYNEVLSYERANAVIEHMVNNHGIGRGRLVLQYGGQDDALVPSTSSYMNRRVEFSVARPDDVEMDPPANYNKSKTDGY